MKATIIGTTILLATVAITSALHNWIALATFFTGMACAAFFTYTKTDNNKDV